jgi:hypothetical protein
MALPTSIWLKREGNDDWIPLTSITNFCVGWRLVPDDWYRDSPPNWSPGTAEVFGTTPSTVPSASIPVHLPEGVTVPSITYTGISGSVPDEVAHIDPRMRYVVREGYYVAWDSASIPAVVQPTARSVMFSTNASTDLCTVVMSATFTSVNATEIHTSANHGLITGDFVTVSNSGGALPSGLFASTVYSVLVLTDSTFQLNDTSGNLVLISTNGTGTQTWTRVGTTHGFISGDRVSIAKNGNTLTGITETTRYVVLSTSATTFRLLTEAGAIVDIQTTNANPVFTMALISTQQRPANLPSGIAWYPMPCDLATADPRA